jgi:uncharacterized membrane protein YgcG
MTAVNPPIVTFTGGIIGGELHNRVDIPSYPQGAETMENMRPKLTGPMTRRPPMLHIDAFSDHSKKAKSYEFVYSGNAAFLVRHTSDGFAFFLDDVRVTIPAVSASLGAWADASTAPSSSTTTSGVRWLYANGAARSIARKTITTSNPNVLHVVAFEIQHGPVNVRIGTATLGKDLMSYLRLAEGVHQLAFTPTGATSYLEFWHDDNGARAIKDTVSILSGPTLLLPTPFTEADLLTADTEQIKDVLYITHNSYWPRRLERRGQHSWSIVKHLPGDGPWGDLNTTNVTIAASNTSGLITLTASEDMFVAAETGVLWKLTGNGQTRTATATAANIATGGVKVTGSGQGDSTAVAPGTSGSGSGSASDGGWTPNQGGQGGGGDSGGGDSGGGGGE